MNKTSQRTTGAFLGNGFNHRLLTYLCPQTSSLSCNSFSLHYHLFSCTLLSLCESSGLLDSLLLVVFLFFLCETFGLLYSFLLVIECLSVITKKKKKTYLLLSLSLSLSLSLIFFFFWLKILRQDRIPTYSQHLLYDDCSYHQVETLIDFFM